MRGPTPSTEYWPPCTTPPAATELMATRAGRRMSDQPVACRSRGRRCRRCSGLATHVAALQKPPATQALSALQMVPHAPAAHRNPLQLTGAFGTQAPVPLQTRDGMTRGVGGVARWRRVAHQAGGVDAAGARAVAGPWCRTSSPVWTAHSSRGSSPLSAGTQLPWVVPLPRHARPGARLVAADLVGAIRAHAVRAGGARRSESARAPRDRSRVHIAGAAGCTAPPVRLGLHYLRRRATARRRRCRSRPRRHRPCCRRCRRRRRPRRPRRAAAHVARTAASAGRPATRAARRRAVTRAERLLAAAARGDEQRDDANADRARRATTGAWRERREVTVRA